jgi:hypothetical protein
MGMRSALQGRLAALLAAVRATLTAGGGDQPAHDGRRDPSGAKSHRHELLSWSTMRCRETVICAKSC